jgi:hypothetical protein
MDTIADSGRSHPRGHCDQARSGTAVKKEEIKKVMLEWQDQVVPAAVSSLANLFDSATTVLSEYAGKAENSALRAMFIDGRHELWEKKGRVEQLFNDRLSRDLYEFLRPAPPDDAPGSETLSLVSKDSFERSLALQTICEQATQNNLELYHALSQRLGVIAGGPVTPYQLLPAGPYQLARVFEGAVGVLAVEPRVLLTLFTLFEREVICNVPIWHHELNESLRKGGVLPNLRYELKLDPDRGIRPSSRRSSQPSGELRPGVPITFGMDPSGGGGPSATSMDNPSAVHNAGEPSGEPFSGVDGTGTLIGSGPDDPLYSGAGEGSQGLGDQLLGRIRDLLVAQRSRRLQSGEGYVRPDPVHPASTAAVSAAIESDEVQRASPVPDTGVFKDGAKRVVVPRELLEKLRAALATQRSTIKDSVGDDRLSHFDEDTIDIVGMLFEVMLNDDRLSNVVKALLSHLHTPYLKLAVRDRVFLQNHQHPARRLLDNMVEAGSRWVDERDLTLGIYPRLQHIVDLVMKADDRPLTLLHELNEGLSADIDLRSKRQQVREKRTIEAEKGKARLDEARSTAMEAAQQFIKEKGSPAPYQEFINGPWTDYLTLLYLRSNGSTDTEIWRSAQALCGRLSQSVDALSAGDRPSDKDLNALQDELTQCLGGVIPHYEVNVMQLFEVFAEDNQLTIVAPEPVPEPEESVKIKLSVRGSALLKRLPNLPPGTWVSFHEDDGDRVVKLSWLNPKTERFLFVDQVGGKALVVPLRQLADKIDREEAHVLLATGASYVESSMERALSLSNKRSSYVEQILSLWNKRS